MQALQEKMQREGPSPEQYIVHHENFWRTQLQQTVKTRSEGSNEDGEKDETFGKDNRGQFEDNI